MSGTKHDKGKTRYELLDPLFLEEMGRVLTYGAVKYETDGAPCKIAVSAEGLSTSISPGANATRAMNDGAEGLPRRKQSEKKNLNKNEPQRRCLSEPTKNCLRGGEKNESCGPPSNEHNKNYGTKLNTSAAGISTEENCVNCMESHSMFYPQRWDVGAKSVGRSGPCMSTTTTPQESIEECCAPNAIQGLECSKPEHGLLSTSFVTGQPLSNWQKGLEESRIFGALMRHIFAVRRGEIVDPESGLPHLAHAAANLQMLSWYLRPMHYFERKANECENKSAQ